MSYLKLWRFKMVDKISNNISNLDVRNNKNSSKTTLGGCIIEKVKNNDI